MHWIAAGALALLATNLVPAQSSAPLFTDPAGDANGTGVSLPLSDPRFDVVAAHVAAPAGSPFSVRVELADGAPLVGATSAKRLITIGFQRSGMDLRVDMDEARQWCAVRVSRARDGGVHTSEFSERCPLGQGRVWSWEFPDDWLTILVGAVGGESSAGDRWSDGVLEVRDAAALSGLPPVDAATAGGPLVVG
jgi:hypothetical protein